MKFAKLYIILTILLIASQSLFGGNFYYPASSSEYKFIHDIIDRDISYADHNDAFAARVGPYNFKFDSSYIPSIGFGNSKAKYPLRVAALVSENVTSAKYRKTTSFESVRGILTAEPSDNISFYVNFLLDEELDENPAYEGKKWRGFAGEIENAFIFYRKNRLTLQAGRFVSFWGPARESLIFSETSRPMDAISLRYHWGFLHYTFQTGKLDRMRLLSENETGFENRYFSGHRLDLKLNRNLFVGLFETIIYGGPGRPMEFAYLNPFLFYHAYQLNENYNDNTFLGLDITYFLKGKYKLYSQFLIDDFQIDNEVRGDNEPNEIGFIFGVHIPQLYEHYELKAEYLAITNRTYNQVIARNRYGNRGALLGNDYGPDGDRFQLILSRWFNKIQRLSASIEYKRKGEGRYTDQWTKPWMDDDNYAEPFPTGVVEKTVIPTLGFTGFIKKYFFVDATAGVEFVKNFRHMDGESRTIPYFELRLTAMLYSNK